MKTLEVEKIQTQSELTTTIKVSKKRADEIQKQLADDVFEQIYNNSDMWQYGIRRLQGILNWWREDKDYHDKQMCEDRLMSALYTRLTNAKIKTLQTYVDNEEAQKKLLKQVSRAANDEEVNNDKIYETVRKEVESYDWKTDTTSVNVKQVREYAPTVSLDKDNVQSDGYNSYSLGDSLSIDDVKTPAIESVPDRLDVIQVLRNTSLFTQKTQPFVQMLLTQGAEATKINLGLSQMQFNSKLKQVLRYIEKHKNMFDAIPRGSQKVLTELSEFETVVQLYHPTQIEKWLRDSSSPWSKELVDNNNISEWDRNEFRLAVKKLKATYGNEVSR